MADRARFLVVLLTLALAAARAFGGDASPLDAELAEVVDLAEIKDPAPQQRKYFSFYIPEIEPKHDDEEAPESPSTPPDWRCISSPSGAKTFWCLKTNLDANHQCELAKDGSQRNCYLRFAKGCRVRQLKSEKKYTCASVRSWRWVEPVSAQGVDESPN